MSSSVFTDPYPFDCNLEYNPFWETSMYLGTVFYLCTGLFLHVSIVKTLLVTERQIFKESSFFNIYVTDSIASTLLIIGDLSFNRLFLFVSPLCPIVGPYFWNPSLILKFVMVFLNHLRFSKSVAQTFLVLNRMCCVMMPVSYDQTWKRLTPFVIFLVIFLPFTGTWNMMISRIVVQPIRGGFGINYIRNVQWAAVSLFQSIFILTALFFTIICTSVTLYKLMFLSDRIKSAEKSLCITSIFISSTFLLVAATQLDYTFCPTCHSDLHFILQFLAFDTFTVGSAVIMILTNKQLRSSVFKWSRPKKSGGNLILVSRSGLHQGTSDN